MEAPPAQQTVHRDRWAPFATTAVDPARACPVTWPIRPQTMLGVDLVGTLSTPGGKLGSFCQKSDTIGCNSSHKLLWIIGCPLQFRNLYLAVRATPTHLDGAALEYRIAEALQQGLPDAGIAEPFNEPSATRLDATADAEYGQPQTQA
jgi:hypothetical protein